MLAFEFEKLQVYTKAREFRKRIYKLANLLPKDEYKLKIQMRDAARSLTNCLAEGHGRFTFPDRIHFCRESRGSLMEFVDDINLCEDEAYARPDHLATLRTDAADVLKDLNGYTKYLETMRRNNATTRRPRPSSSPPTSPEVPITNYQLLITVPPSTQRPL